MKVTATNLTSAKRALPGAIGWHIFKGHETKTDIEVAETFSPNKYSRVFSFGTPEARADSEPASASPTVPEAPAAPKAPEKKAPTAPDKAQKAPTPTPAAPTPQPEAPAAPAAPVDTSGAPAPWQKGLGEEG